MNNTYITSGNNFTYDENSTSDEEQYRYEASLQTKIIVLVFFGLVILVGIVGNLIVLLLIALEKSMHTTVNRCLFVLAVADLLILVFLPILPIGAEFFDDASYAGRTMCYFLNFYDRGAVVCSALIFFFLSVDRYFAICHPLKIRRIWSGRNTNIALVLIWIVALGSSIPYIYISTYEEWKKDNTTYYYCYLTEDEPWKINYDAAMSIIIFFVPIPFLVFLYGRMISVLKKAVPGDTTEAGKSTASRRGRLQVVIMLLSVVIIFIVCQIPFTIVLLLFSFSSEDFNFADGGKVTYILTWIFRIMIYINSAANPIVYFCVSSNFRKAFLNVFCCQRKSQTDHSRSLGQKTECSTL